MIDFQMTHPDRGRGTTAPPSHHGVRDMQTSMPWTVYRADRIKRGQAPQNETLVSGHFSASEAMDEANRLKRSDPAHSYSVGGL